MGKFLRENWLWIVLPMILAAAVLIFVIYFFEGDEITPFIYDI